MLFLPLVMMTTATRRISSHPEQIYHPRVKDDGSICLPILSDEWNPSLTLADVGRQVVELLQAPDAEDGAVNPEIAAQMRDDAEGFRRTVRSVFFVSSSSYVPVSFDGEPVGCAFFFPLFSPLQAREWTERYAM